MTVGAQANSEGKTPQVRVQAGEPPPLHKERSSLAHCPVRQLRTSFPCSSLKQSTTVWLAILLCASPLTWSYGNSDASRAVQERIKSLGAGDPNDFEPLYQYPVSATRFLVAELHVIKRGSYRTSEAEGFGPINHEAAHVIWCIRALRSLTGLNFKATTNAQLDEKEGHFLGYANNREVSFFGTWMSRDLSFVAPEDAQQKIIAKWKSWFTEHGTTYKYVNERNIDKWYF